MLARRFAMKLRPALRDSGLSLWDVCQRTGLDVADIATALGGRNLLPTDLLEVIGQAVGLELSFVPASATPHTVGPVRSIVDQAIERFTPGRLAAPIEQPWLILALDFEALVIPGSGSFAARPGLFEFLECARALFPRVVVFTTLVERQFLEVAHSLVQQAAAPDWFAAVELVDRHEPSKGVPLALGSPPPKVMLVEGGYDDDLQRIMQVLVDRLST